MPRKIGRYGKYTKIGYDQMQRIRWLFCAGTSIRDIGRMTGVPYTTIACHMRKLHPEVARSKGGAGAHRNAQK